MIIPMQLNIDVYSVFMLLAWQWITESDSIEISTLSEEGHYESSNRKHKKKAIHPIL